MNRIKYILKNALPKTLLNHITKIYLELKKSKINREFKDIVINLKQTKNNKRILLIGTAVYGNIGDHAISIAEREFLCKEFPNIPVIEIPISLYELNSKLIDKNITKRDLLIINGGGFLGTLWPTGQEIANSIIKNHPNNRIIIFPQTVFYNENCENKLEHDKKVISNHPNVSLIVRDNKSFEFIKNNNFKYKSVILTPDIVTYLDGNRFHKSEGKIIFVLRKDHEKIDYNNSVKQLEEYFKGLGYEANDFVYTDSVVNGFYNLYNRKDIVKDYLEKIGKGDFVVSDRLHGMILASICGIPVIALDNVSNKVFGAYEWLSVYPFVLFFKENNLFEKIEKIFLEKNNYRYEPSKFAEFHTSIKELVQAEYDEII